MAMCLIGLGVLIPGGLGERMSTLSAPRLSYYLKVGDEVSWGRRETDQLQGEYVTLIFHNLCVTMPKVALLAFYRRIFKTAVFRHVVNATIAFIVASCISILFPQIFMCTPLERAWNLKAAGRCLDLKILLQVDNVLHLVANIFIFILPIPMILRLQVSRKRKLALSSIFLIGLL